MSFRGLSFPAWITLWFGLYATWEGILLQCAAAVFVIGSYVVAEWLRQRRHRADAVVPVVSQPLDDQGAATASSDAPASRSLAGRS